MKYLKLFEHMNKEIIDISDFEKRIRGGEDINIENILIKLPDNRIMSFEDYIEGGFNMKYSTPQSDHSKSPLLKDKKPVPKGLGSEKRKRRYWEDIYENIKKNIDNKEKLK